MTLKEKFKIGINFPSKVTLDNCEVIAVEFAIDFADWIRVCKLKGRPYDFENIEELLIIYKEEKEL